MTSYPALVQLVRLLGREDALQALGTTAEPQPAALTPAQRQALGALVERELERIATGIAAEAAASDDVMDRQSGLAFVEDRLRSYADLMTADQVIRLREAAARLVAAWN